MSEADEDTTVTLGKRPGPLSAPAPTSPRRAYLKVLTGAAAGQLLRLDMDEATFGRGVNNDLVLEDSLISRVHARLSKTPEGKILLTDLDSRNGTFVQGAAIKSRLLEEGDEILVGGVILNFTHLNHLEEDLHKRLYSEANLDALTGIMTRRAFMSRLQWELELAGARQLALTVALLDADHFKNVNDTHGHPAGDAVLQELAARVRKSLRSRDCFGRYGGEEFGLVLPELPFEAAHTVLERVRREVGGAPFVVPTPSGQQSITVTISIGAAAFEASHKTGEEILRNADEALYQAKQAGRDRVVVFTPKLKGEPSPPA